jgi:hypothetical protein
LLCSRSLGSTASPGLHNWYSALGPRQQRQPKPRDLYGVVDHAQHELKVVVGADGHRHAVWVKKRRAARASKGVRLLQAHVRNQEPPSFHFTLPAISTTPSFKP